MLHLFRTPLPQTSLPIGSPADSRMSYRWNHSLSCFQTAFFHWVICMQGSSMSSCGLMTPSLITEQYPMVWMTTISLVRSMASWSSCRLVHGKIQQCAGAGGWLLLAQWLSSQQLMFSCPLSAQKDFRILHHIPSAQGALLWAFYISMDSRIIVDTGMAPFSGLLEGSSFCHTKGLWAVCLPTDTGLRRHC